ncbi:hypothetical protein AT575_02225 [Streptococcus penaeicida]|uniref:Phosphopentomutase n=1 Tax=Streptococcus penaeicida TaxID=1765960 RepID=A0A2N8LDL0_9STRE|nr:DUF1697 domain-containing protein [Streptococcus penaeicida]PND48255.1 hypothetical protein AT575_02225 [Streptococcus penaeicida]
MTDYILLLRGINVGGHHKVSMAILKSQLEEASFEAVSSYINSGNLLFSSDLLEKEIITRIKSIFENDYDFPIPFLLLNKADYQEEFSQLPDWWSKDHFRKNVLFFLPTTEKEMIDQFMNQLDLKTGEVLYRGQFALYWTIDKEENYAKSYYHSQLAKQKLYKEVSIRNGKTSLYLATT